MSDNTAPTKGRSFEEMFSEGELHVSDFLYVLRDTAGREADELKAAIDKATKLWELLNGLADRSEDSAQLVAASDIEPMMTADVPKSSGLRRKDA